VASGGRSAHELAQGRCGKRTPLGYRTTSNLDLLLNSNKPSKPSRCTLDRIGIKQKLPAASNLSSHRTHSAGDDAVIQGQISQLLLGGSIGRLEMLGGAEDLHGFSNLGLERIW